MTGRWMRPANSVDSPPESCTRSSPAASAMLFTSSTSMSAKMPTMSGRQRAADCSISSAHAPNQLFAETSPRRGPSKLASLPWVRFSFSASTMSKHCWGVTLRFDSANIMPMKSAPACAASRAVSGSRSPQILTSVIWSPPASEPRPASGHRARAVTFHRPTIARITPAGSSATISASPTSTAPAPAA